MTHAARGNAPRGGRDRTSERLAWLANHCPDLPPSLALMPLQLEEQTGEPDPERVRARVLADRPWLIEGAV